MQVRDTGMTINDNPRVALTLQVNPTDGSPPFQTSTKVTVSRVAIPRAGDSFVVRYDPEDHDNFAIGEAAGGGQAGPPIEDIDAGTIASAVAADSSAVQRGSAAELLANGKRMTAVVREYSDTGKTVGDTAPDKPDPMDPIYVFKIEIPLELGSPIEAMFLHRVPLDKVSQLNIGERLNVAVNPANPTREVAIDWATSPVM
ncbi:MAG: hypothetical protein ACJ764_11870 [Solirubrobacteraceae bacterium]